MKLYTKESLIETLREIRHKGWIRNQRPGNSGGVGNTLEDLLGIQENNLPIPNAAEWELKCQRVSDRGSHSLATLFHMEPSPRAIRFVPQVLLPKYGWPHQEAGRRYPEDEASFRQTIHGQGRSDRGFGIVVDRKQEKVLVSFDADSVQPHHYEWLKSVEERAGLRELDPQPYWGFDDLRHKAGTKLLNCFYVCATVKREEGVEYYHYEDIYMMRGFSFDGFLRLLESGDILVDFDARTGHNHGTKFRIRQGKIQELYEDVTEL